MYEAAHHLLLIRSTIELSFISLKIPQGILNIKILLQCHYVPVQFNFNVDEGFYSQVEIYFPLSRVMDKKKTIQQ